MQIIRQNKIGFLLEKNINFSFFLKQCKKK